MTIEEAEKEAKRAITEYTEVKDTIASMEVFLKVREMLNFGSDI